MTMPDFSSEHKVAIANDDLSLIDPALRGPVEDTIEDLLAEAAADPIDALDADAVDSSKGVITKIRQTRRTKTTTMAVAVLDRVSEELLSDETSLTDSQLANLTISSFNHMVPSDSFFLGQEPMSGTTACRFCGKDLLTENNRRASHAIFCQKTMMQQIIDSVDSDHTRPITCSWDS
jgi:hypothetical protein